MLTTGNDGIPKGHVQFKIVLLLTICVAALPLHAAVKHPVEFLINKAVSNFIQHKIKLGKDEVLKFSISSTRGHTKIPPCSSGFTANFPNNMEQSNTVELSCPDRPLWHMYVPVDIQIFTNVVTARTMLSPGQVITSNDIVLSSRNKNVLYNGFFRNVAEVCDKIAYQIIPENTVITNKNVRPKVLIKKNQTILVVSRKDNVEVSMEGIAITDGYLHEPIKILNKTSKKVVDGVVISSSRAEINTN